MGISIYFKGGDWHDAGNYEPPQVPTNDDDVVTDQCTIDIIVNDIPFAKSIDFRNFKGDVYYALRQKNGVLRNNELDAIFIDRQDIRRIE